MHLQGDELLSWGTAKQFISGPKATCEQKWPRNEIWVSQEWYTRVRSDIEKTIARRCIELGVPVEDKSEPVGRELLFVLNETMLSMADINEQIRAIEFRAAINMAFAAI